MFSLFAEQSLGVTELRLIPFSNYIMRCHSDILVSVVLGAGVWEALDVSGRGTAPASQRL